MIEFIAVAYLSAGLFFAGWALAEMRRDLDAGDVVPFILIAIALWPAVLAGRIAWRRP